MTEIEWFLFGCFVGFALGMIVGILWFVIADPRRKINDRLEKELRLERRFIKRAGPRGK